MAKTEHAMMEFMRRTANNLDELGAPNICLEGLKIWVRGRQYPDATDYWDGNWLLVIIECRSDEALVTVGGPIIHLSEIARWADAAEKASATLQGEVNLSCMEPELSVKMAVDKTGHMTMQVDILSDHLTNWHHFQFEIDQSYLPQLIRECRSVLNDFPIVAPEEVGDANI